MPRSALLTLHKLFIRTYLDYGDITPDQSRKASLSDIESFQNNTTSAITTTAKETSRIKLYHELGLEKLSSKKRMWRLCHYYKLLVDRSPSYLYHTTP